jgi:hypothetical protein
VFHPKISGGVNCLLSAIYSQKYAIQQYFAVPEASSGAAFQFHSGSRQAPGNNNQ